MNHTNPQPESAPIPVQGRTTSRKLFVWFGNAIILSYFTVGIAMGLQYITGLALGLCILFMCWFVVIIMFFFGGYKLFIAPVADFHVGVLVNRFFGPRIPKTDEQSLYLGPGRFLEEISSGIWNPRFFWQGVVYVDVRRHIPIGDKEVVAYSQDQVLHTFIWIGTVRAVPGFCCTLVRIGSVAAIRVLSGLTDAGGAEMIGRLPYKEIQGNLTKLGTGLTNLYGGDKNMSLREQGCGLAIEDLALKEVKRSQKLQDSAELVEQAENLAAARRALQRRGDKSVTDIQALETMLTQAEKAQLKIYRGLENLDGNKVLIQE